MKNKKFWVSLLAGIMAGVMLLTLLLGLLASTAHAESSSEIKNQIVDMENRENELQSQINALKGQQQENLTEITQIVAQKDNIDQQIALMYAQVDVINEQIAAYSVLIADIQEDLDEAEARLEELNEKNKDRIRAMEEDGELSYWSVLFKANSFADLLDRLNMIEEIAASDRRRLQEMSNAAKEVQETKDNLQIEKTALQAKKDELAATQAELDAKNAETQELLAQLAAQGEEYRKLLIQEEQRHEQLMQEILNRYQDYDAAKREEWLAQLATATKPTPPPTTAPTTAPTTEPTVSGGSSGGTGGVVLPSDNGGWMVPTSYTMVTSPFGMRADPFTGEQVMHLGVDLWARDIAGKPIYATRSGVVVCAGYDNGGGNMVFLDHLDGYMSAYLHMTYFTVKEGDVVAQGQIIGYVGSSGRSTAAHLDFRIAYNGEYLNPMDFIS